jgi:hypothetical protein
MQVLNCWNCGDCSPSVFNFKISHIFRAPKLLEYFVKNYPNRFVCSPNISVLEHIPLKISHLKFDKLASYINISQVEYLVLHLPKNLDNSSKYGWDNYQELTSFCPNLKGILFYQKDAGKYQYKNLMHLYGMLQAIR